MGNAAERASLSDRAARRRDATGGPLPDLELLRRNSEIDFNATVDDTHRIRVHREDCGKRSHFASKQIESRAVARALHKAVLELPLAQDATVVGADVVDRAPGAVLTVPDAEARALSLHNRNFARRDVAGIGDADETAQAAAPSTSAMRPMRGASASVTRVRIC